jgi:hypothetical protein
MVSKPLVITNDEKLKDVEKQMDEIQRKKNFIQLTTWLCHARHCTYGLNCSIIPYCDQWNTVWKHVLVCKDTECTFPQCLSSKIVLAHFQHCARKDECEYCSAAVHNILRTRCAEKKESLKRKRSLSSENLRENSNSDIASLGYVDTLERKSSFELEGINFGRGKDIQRDLKTPNFVGSIGDEQEVNVPPRSKLLKLRYIEHTSGSSSVPVTREHACREVDAQAETEKEKIISDHLRLVNHSIACLSRDCPSKNCFKMKELITHHKHCNVDNCQLCRRINNLYFLHNKACPYQGTTCPLEKCQEFTAANKKSGLMSSFASSGHSNVPHLSSLKTEV